MNPGLTLSIRVMNFDVSIRLKQTYCKRASNHQTRPSVQSDYFKTSAAWILLLESSFCGVLNELHGKDGDHDFPGNLKGSKSFLSQHFPWPWSPTRLQRSAMVVGEGLGVHGGKWGSAPYWKNPKLPMAQVRPAGMRQPETWNLLVGCTDNLVHNHICTYLQSLRSSHHNDKWIQKHVSGFWMKYNDLTVTSLEWYCNNLNHPQVALLQLLTAWWIIKIQPDLVFQCYSLIPTWLRRW